MTNREAIFLLKTLQKEYTGEWDIEAFDMAIAALEKQEPKVVKNKEIFKGVRFGKCPVCGESVNEFMKNYCDDCGQKLSWKEDVE